MPGASGRATAEAAEGADAAAVVAAGVVQAGEAAESTAWRQPGDSGCETHDAGDH